MYVKISLIESGYAALNLFQVRWKEAIGSLFLTAILWLWYLWGRVELLDADGKKIPGPSNDYFNFSSETHPVQIFRNARLNKRASTCIQTIMLPRLGDGQVCGFRALGNPVMITSNPDVMRTVLSGKFDEFPKAARYDRLRTFLRDGLVTSQGMMWKTHRGIINRGFAAEKFNFMIQVFIDTICDKVAVWKKECAASTSTGAGNSVAVDMNSQMSTLTTVIICKTAFSYTVDTTVDRNENFGDVNLLLEEINCRLVQPTNWWHHLDPAQEKKVNAEIEKTNVLIDKIIAQRLQSRSESKEKDEKTARDKKKATASEVGTEEEEKKKQEDPRDLLDILLDSSEEAARESGTPVVITPGQLRDHILTFLAAGHETTSTTMQVRVFSIRFHFHFQLVFPSHFGR
jgi:cytochrome P450